MSTPPPSHLSAPVSPPPPHQSQRKRKDINRPGSDNDSSTDSSSERSSKKACISGSLDVEIQLLLRDVKRYVRTDQPFLKFSEIFQTVLHYGPLSAELDEDETLEFDSERSEELWNRWLSLKQAIPSLEDTFTKSTGTSSAFASLVRILDKSVGIARSDDTKHMRDIIPTWLAGYQEARHLGSKAKSGRGFMNEVTGAFLCPVHIKWLENEDETAALRDRRTVPSPQEWPNFLYSYDASDPDDEDDARYLPTPTWSFDASQPWKGFCRGELLLKTWAYLFAGSASISEDGRPTIIGGHTRFMTGITKASIAYAAMQLRHALNSEERFVVEPKGSQFNNPKFYYSILSLLGKPQWKNEVDDLLRFYNHKFFPHLRNDGKQRTSNSTLSIFDAALNARSGLDSEDGDATA